MTSGMRVWNGRRETRRSASHFLPVILLVLGPVPASIAADRDEAEQRAAQALVEQRCTLCHALPTVTNRRATRDEWQQIVDRMVSYGAQVAGTEAESIVTYLAGAFGPRGDAKGRIGTGAAIGATADEPDARTDAGRPSTRAAGNADSGRSRGEENAVTQADDAFGFSVGKESVGLYTNSNVRGFSPVTAGNVRIDGLYFDQVFRLTNRVSGSTSIRVGLSALGNPFPSPTGIVDYSLFRPDDTPSLSALLRFDSYGSASIEADAVVPLVQERLSLGVGAYFAGNESYDGTDNFQHIEGATLRWQPSPELELMPFWTRSEISDDERGPLYVPSGQFLPPPVPVRRFEGPGWTKFNSVGISQGIVASWSPSAWLLRAGLFRSQLDDDTDFSHLLMDLEPDGSANRVILADPPSWFASTSGEVRLSRGIAEGDRRHLVHLSLRARNRFQRYGGFDVLDYGPTRIGEPFHPPEPDYDFGPQARDRVKQWTGGIAYEGRWRGVGDLNVGVYRTDYRKRVDLPATLTATTVSRPWLYYGTLAFEVSEPLTVYASYMRGLEESGVAPENAVNRNEPLPAIITSQVEVGLRYGITESLKLVAAAFDLRKPYYNLDQDNRFAQLGDVRNRGVELSLSGGLTSTIDVVAGAVLLRPRVTGEGVTLGRVGARPVGMPERTIIFNADWRPPGPEGLSFDIKASYQSRTISTRDNSVAIPGRTLVDLGGRYRFKLAARDATLRFQVANVGGEEGFDVKGAGAYDIIAGRLASAYLAVDF